MQQSLNHAKTDRPVVRYDAIQRRVTIRQGQHAHVLPDRYASYDEGMIAGYAYLRAQGWDPVA